MNEEKEKVEEATAEVKEEAEATETAAAATTPSGAEAPPPSGREAKDGGKEEDGEMQKLREELESVRGQLTRMEHERYLLSHGVPEEDLDYYAFKIEHMDGAGADFKKAAKEYLKAHPVRRTTVSSGAELGAGSARKPATSSELMNQLLREKR